MGGNAKAVHRSTGTTKVFEDRICYAEKIPLSQVDPSALVKDIDDLVRELNSLSIWSDSEKQAIFFGSFATLRDLEDRTSFLEFRDYLGDVDIAVPIGKMGILHSFLVRQEDKAITQELVYIGQNRQTFSGKKLNCIFYYKRCSKFLQIDFEGLDFSTLEYVRFMRSSPLVDMKENIKGLAHKYLLACIARTISYKPNIVILTPKSALHPIDKMRVKVLNEIPHSLTFSKEGLREKLQQQFRMGFPVMLHGKYAYKEIPKEECVFETKIKAIYKKLFMKEPVGKDIDDFSSYMGLLNLVSKNFTRGKIETIYRHMVEWKLWGRTGQALSRNSAEDDKSIKEMIIYTMESKFPYLVGQVPLEKIIEEYYVNYEEREDEE